MSKRPIRSQDSKFTQLLTMTTTHKFPPQEDGSASAIWEGQGHDILCRVEDDLTVEVGFPPGLDPRRGNF